MSNPRQPSSGTSTDSDDAFAPSPTTTRPVEPETETDTMQGTQVGDEMIKDPIIINR
jgi:hypothetical protein